jgi:glycerophosphoryl diester phosphodiesterase
MYLRQFDDCVGLKKIQARSVYCNNFFMIQVVVIIAGFILYVTYKTRKTPVPHTDWQRFRRKGTVPLDSVTCNDLQGVYTVTEGKEIFGNSCIVKWTYTIEKQGPIYHLSFFGGKEGAFIVCEGRRDGNDILLKGSWRQLTGSETGTVQLVIRGSKLHGTGDKHGVSIEGYYGKKEETPRESLRFNYKQPIPGKKPLDILAHRGGARNVDFLSTSENSLEMMKMAARLGANGIEIDVRLTKDGVPVIIHDSFLSIHTFNNLLYDGLISNHTLAELKAKELRKGGHIPTLQEALHTVLYQTPLEIVWLDIKKECDLEQIRALQMEYMQKAKEEGRQLTVYIGIPDKSILGCFRALEDHQQLPSLTELDPEVAEAINANAWAPQYTGGLQADDVQRMQMQGRKAYVWSLDDAAMIHLYIQQGGFDGIVTNAPPVAFHTYYMPGEINVTANGKIN